MQKNSRGTERELKSKLKMAGLEALIKINAEHKILVSYPVFLILFAYGKKQKICYISNPKNTPICRLKFYFIGWKSLLQTDPCILHEIRQTWLSV